MSNSHHNDLAEAVEGSEIKSLQFQAESYTTRDRAQFCPSFVVPDKVRARTWVSGHMSHKCDVIMGCWVVLHYLQAAHPLARRPVEL